MECWSDGEKLYTRDFHASGSQLRVDGVCGAYFELNGKKNMLTLCLMIRGDDAGLAGRPLKNRGCPEEFISRWSPETFPYALYAFRYTWLLPNM